MCRVWPPAIRKRVFFFAHIACFLTCSCFLPCARWRNNKPPMNLEGFVLESTRRLFQEEWDFQRTARADNTSEEITESKSMRSNGGRLAVAQTARLETLKKAAMRPEDSKPFLHVTGGLLICILAVASGIFDGAPTDTGYEHYAEPTVPGMPAFLAMPANCLINLAYVLLGWYWWSPGDQSRQAYFQEVFALMALLYGPTQWVRLWTQHHRAAVLDQWLTLPIFAWVIVWCLFLENGWEPYVFLAIEVTSLTSYVLAALHPQGFELALSGHIMVVFWRVLKVQRRLGNASSIWIIALGTMCCFGFVSLKVWDRELAQWAFFSRLTGHFWSKVCDVLQFHCAFLFLTSMTRRRLSRVK